MCLHVFVLLCLYLCLYVYMCVCVCVFACVFVCMHMQTARTHLLKTTHNGFNALVEFKSIIVLIHHICSVDCNLL